MTRTTRTIGSGEKASSAEVSQNDFRYFLGNPQTIFRLRPDPGSSVAVLVLCSRPPILKFPGFSLRIYACALQPSSESDTMLAAMVDELDRLAG